MSAIIDNPTERDHFIQNLKSIGVTYNGSLKGIKTSVFSDAWACCLSGKPITNPKFVLTPVVKEEPVPPPPAVVVEEPPPAVVVEEPKKRVVKKKPVAKTPPVEVVETTPVVENVIPVDIKQPDVVKQPDVMKQPDVDTKKRPKPQQGMTSIEEQLQDLEIASSPKKQRVVKKEYNPDKMMAIKFGDVVKCIEKYIPSVDALNEIFDAMSKLCVTPLQPASSDLSMFDKKSPKELSDVLEKVVTNLREIKTMQLSRDEFERFLRAFNTSITKKHEEIAQLAKLTHDQVMDAIINFNVYKKKSAAGSFGKE